MTEFIPAHPNNYKRGRDGQTISYIIIHSVVGSLNSCVKTFQDPNRIASAHYIVGYDGRVVQMVSEADTAYHAGNWTINTQSIGIEHDDQARPYDPRPDTLYNASAALVADICNRYGIPCDRSRIRMHREVSLNPTACPAALDIDRIVVQAHAILHPAPPPTPPPPPEPEWKINLAEIGPHIRKVEQDVTLRNFDTGASVKTYPKGTEITVEFKTNAHLVEWYMTRYSVSKGIPNGFVVSEFDWEEPIVEPPPVEPPEIPPTETPESPQEPSEPPEDTSVPPKPEDVWSLDILWVAIKEFWKWLSNKFSRK